MVLLFVSVFVIALIVGTFIGNLLGWASTHGGAPFNWRVFLGPTVYFRWANSAK